jgi:osmotically-inducible protein OsmY
LKHSQGIFAGVFIMKSDTELRSDIQTTLEFEPGIDDKDIAVSAKDGVITLMGHVPSFYQKWHAESVAKRVRGVTGLANEITVKLGSERDDTDIAKAATTAIDADVRLPLHQIRVIVNNGWITLEGKVPFYYQEDAAASDVRHLMGVKGVTNSITVAPTVSASGVRGKIEAAFKRNALIDADKILVEIQGNKVILDGSVRSWEERDEAEDGAWAAPGVANVENRLTVGG